VSFDLEVTFSGLTLLVPVGARELWALMVEHKPGKPEDLHHPLVVWPPPFTPQDTPPYRSIIGRSISYVGKDTGTDVRMQLQRVSGNLSKAHKVYARRNANENWFTGSLSPHFTAQVKLTNVDGIDASGGRWWRYGKWGTVRLFTHVTAALSQHAGTELTVPLGSTLPALKIKPDADNVVRVGFFNVPETELEKPSLGNEPLPNAAPKHFHVLATLLGIPPGAFPKYVSPQPRRPSRELEPLVRQGIRGVTPYACLTFPLCPDDEQSC
jgi:hypothetical protein